MVCYSQEMPEKVTFKTGISLPPSLREGAMARAKDVAGGKFARYVQHLIRADIANEPAPTSFDPEILVKLAQSYAGFLAPTFKKQLVERAADQPRLLHDLLLQISDYFAAGGSIEDIQIGRRQHYAPPAHPAQPSAPSTVDYRKFQSEQSDPQLNEESAGAGDQPPATLEEAKRRAEIAEASRLAAEAAKLTGQKPAGIAAGTGKVSSESRRS